MHGQHPVAGVKPSLLYYFTLYFTKEEGAASGEEKEYTIRDAVVAFKKMNAEFERSMAELKAEKWIPKGGTFI